MIPGARIKAAIEILDTISSSNEPLDRLIIQYFRKRRYAGSNDRRAINNLTYNIVRNIKKLDWWITRIDSKLLSTPRTQIISELTLEEKLSPNYIKSIFNGSMYCPLPLSENEEYLAKELSGQSINHPDMNTSVIMEYPNWLDNHFKTLWPERLKLEMSALNQPAPVDVRVNTLKTNLEDVRLSLINETISCKPTPMSPVGLRLTSKARLNNTKVFKKGWIEVQDEGSQLVALLSDAKPGMKVVDLCAGAGGKTLALAATMNLDSNIDGQLIACDISSYRIDRLKPRIQRAGIKNINTHILNSQNTDWIKTHTGTKDRVLVDVPCTSTGIWRRDPLSRWRLSIDNLKNNICVQRNILRNASKLVKRGGRLIYATCSLLKEENEHQVSWFTEHHNDFCILPVEDVWGQVIGGKSPSASSLRLTPASNGTDGFFCAILEKFK